MKKVIFLAALGLSVMAQAAEPGYFKTLVAEQADATKGQTQLYNLDYYADGSLLLLSSYSTASKDEVGLHFDGDTYQGGTASKLSLQALTNAFMAKVDKEGTVLWTVPDTTYQFDLGGSVNMATKDGGAIFAQKMRNKKGRYVTFINVHDNTSFVTESNNITASYERTSTMTADPNDSYAWAGLAQDEENNVYLAGYQADTLFPTWKDTIAMRPNKWNGNAQQKSSNCNTVIIKYDDHMKYLAYVINSDDLVYDRPVGMHYENGKLYVVGTYKNSTESGIYAAAYGTDLKREFIEYHPIKGNLQFQQTKFEKGRIYICGGISKGSITIGEKTISTSGNMNNGLVYVINQANGKALNADIHAAVNDALNITVAAFPTATGVIAYNHETLNGIQMAFNYDEDLTLVSIDTLGTGGGSSTISCVARNADATQTAIGCRARTTTDYLLLGQTFNFADKTNWYSVLATLNTKSPSTAIESIQQTATRAEKFIQNGQLLIRHNGKVYNVAGELME